MTAVIIPTFNRPELLADCLASLDDDLEVIVVNNGGPTHDVPATISNPMNYGFARACNQGAAVAESEHLIFLNDDTICRPGWNKILTDQLDDSLICGPVLEYPTGEIQCAGIGVSFDRPPGQEAWNLRTVLRDEPYPVMAVTGAALAIKAETFHRLGEFDQGYWNGYEDVDLCLKAGHIGGKVTVCPDARVTHLESQSGPQRWVAVRENILRLRDRWGADD